MASRQHYLAVNIRGRGQIYYPQNLCGVDHGRAGLFRYACRVPDHPLAVAPVEHFDHGAAERQCAGVEGLLRSCAFRWRIIEAAGGQVAEAPREVCRPGGDMRFEGSEGHTSKLKSL